MKAIGRLIRGGRGRMAVLGAGASAAAFAVSLGLLWLVAGQTAAPPLLAAAIPLPAAALAPPEPPPVVAAGVDGGLTVPAVDPSAIARISVLDAREPLAVAPDPALTVLTPKGPMPKIGADGRAAREVYARPFDRRDDRARIAVIVVGIGLSRVASEAAIERLPGPIVLAIDPAARQPEAWAKAARRSGHEILASLPLAAASAAGDTPRPAALRAAASTERSDEAAG